MRSTYFRLSVKILEELARVGWSLAQLKGATDPLEIFKVFFVEETTKNTYSADVFFKKITEDEDLLKAFFREIAGDKVLFDIYHKKITEDETLSTAFSMKKIMEDEKLSKTFFTEELIENRNVSDIFFKKITEDKELFKVFFREVIRGSDLFSVFFPRTNTKRVKISRVRFSGKEIKDSEISRILFPGPDKKDLDLLEKAFPDLGCTEIFEIFPSKPGRNRKVIENIPLEKALTGDEEILFKIVFSETDVETLKEGAEVFVETCYPHVKFIEVPTRDLLCFLVRLGAKNRWWMLRFWDLGKEGKEEEEKKEEEKEGVKRAISVGRDHPTFYDLLIVMLKGTGRLHEWAGAEVSPPKIVLPRGFKRPRRFRRPRNVRVGLYRYPTASISVRRKTEHRRRYIQLEKIWEEFLIRTWKQLLMGP